MKKMCLALLLFLSSVLLFSQSSDFSDYESLGLIKYTSYDGIAQMQIHCIFQSSKGHLCIGTREGLSIFNGKSFETFRMNDGLPHHVVTDIAEDSNGNLWICTRDGLAKYDGIQITSLPVNTGYSNQIQIDNLDRIWIVNRTEGVLYKVEDNQVENTTNKYPELANKKIGQIRLTKDKNGLYLKLQGNNPIYIFKNDKFKKLENTNSSYIFRDKGKQTWFLSYVPDNSKYILSNIHANEENTQFEIKRYPYNYFYLKDSILYGIGKKSIGSILTKINLNTRTTKIYSGLDINLASTIFVDDENNIWVGSDEGLIKIFDQPFTNFATKEFQNVWGVLEDNYGNHWFPSYTNGLHKIENGILQEFLPQRTSVLQFYMRSLKLESGALLFPNHLGLLQVEDNQASFIDSCWRDCLSQIVVEDKEHKLILSGVKKGVRIIDANGNIKTITGKNQIHKNDYIVAIAKDKLGHYWFSSALGLTKYDIAKNKPMKHYTLSNGNLPVKGAASIFKDKDGDLWFGSEQGLLLYDYASDSFSKVADLKIKTQVNSMIDLKKDYLLIGTVEGLFVLNIQKFKKNNEIELFHYNQRNGFTGLEPTKNGMYKDSKGDIWIPCQNHLVKLDPTKLDLDLETNPIQVEITRIDENKIIGDEIITLRKEKNNTVLECNVISTSAPVPPLFSFKVNNTDWSDWSNKNTFLARNLPHGISTVSVRAKKDIYSNHISEIKSLKLKTNLNFNQRYRFLLTYLIIALVLLIGSFLAWRHIANKRSYKEAKRIKKLLKTYELRSLEARMNPHFIFNSISAVQKHIQLGDKILADKYLVMFSDMLRYFFETFTNERKVESNALYDEVKLKDEIEFLTMYIKLEQELYADFIFEINVEENINHDQPILPMVIQPFVENAICHGLINRENKNTLRVSFQDTDGLICIIEDNGVGIGNSNEKTKISFENFDLSSKNSQLLKNRISMLKEIGLHVDITIESQKSKGTTVTIKFKKNGRSKSSNT